MKRFVFMVVAILAVTCFGWAILRDAARVSFKFPVIERGTPGEWFDLNVEVLNSGPVTSRIVGIDHC